MKKNASKKMNLRKPFSSKGTTSTDGAPLNSAQINSAFTSAMKKGKKY